MLPSGFTRWRGERYCRLYVRRDPFDHEYHCPEADQWFGLSICPGCPTRKCVPASVSQGPPRRS